jgi:predicted alpha/beta superfamily hydrolase
MKQLIFTLSCMVAGYASAQQMPVPSSGKIERISNFNSKFVDARHVDVWLPEGYSTDKKYAVLYMHDGQMLYDSAAAWNKQEWGVDETLGLLMKDKKIKDCIVVGIWNSGKNRHIDYFPQKPFESLTPFQKDTLLKANRTNGAVVFSGKVQSDAYLKFLVTELKPFIDSTYSTLTNRSNTFIAGSSMGGLISMYAICEYPNVFGGAACLSTHWPGTFTTHNNPIPAAFVRYMKKHLPSPKNHRIYFDFGTATLDALYEPYQLQVDAVMKQKRFNAKNWKTLKFEGADHSENAWRNRLTQPILFLMGK